MFVWNYDPQKCATSWNFLLVLARFSGNDRNCFAIAPETLWIKVHATNTEIPNKSPITLWKVPVAESLKAISTCCIGVSGKPLLVWCWGSLSKSQTESFLRRKCNRKSSSSYFSNGLNISLRWRICWRWLLSSRFQDGGPATYPQQNSTRIRDYARTKLKQIMHTNKKQQQSVHTYT